MSFCTGIGNRVRRLRRLTIVYRDRRALAEDIILFRIASTVSCVAITFAVWPAANDAMTAFFRCPVAQCHTHRIHTWGNVLLFNSNWIFVETSQLVGGNLGGELPLPVNTGANRRRREAPRSSSYPERNLCRHRLNHYPSVFHWRCLSLLLECRLLRLAPTNSLAFLIENSGGQ